MKIQQRDIVELSFSLPQGPEHHPALVLSTDDAILAEGAFVAAMITSQKFDDEYFFPLIDDMITRPMSKPYREVRLHLVSLFKTSDVISIAQPRVRVKIDDFEIIVRQIVSSAFGIEL
jgi:hypothetical protein